MFSLKKIARKGLSYALETMPSTGVQTNGQGESVILHPTNFIGHGYNK